MYIEKMNAFLALLLLLCLLYAAYVAYGLGTGKCKEEKDKWKCLLTPPFFADA